MSEPTVIDSEATYSTVLDLAKSIERKMVDAFHTPLPWTAREGEDGWYIAGPPETSVVVEGVSKNDALLITDIVNSAARIASHNILLHKTLFENDDELSEGAVFDLARRLTIELAQATGNPIQLPDVKTAKDLSTLHTGCQISVEGRGSYHIADVISSQDNMISIECMYPESVIILHKDVEVEVTHWWDKNLPLNGVDIVEPPKDSEEEEDSPDPAPNTPE